MSVIIETSVGTIVVDLDLKRAPKCCLNFLKLSGAGRYVGYVFSKVERGFMASCGSLVDPVDNHPKLTHTFGTLSALTSFTSATIPFTSSNFFFTLSKHSQPHLDLLHTPFGKVTEGMDVLERIGGVGVDGEGRPWVDVWVKRCVVVEDFGVVGWRVQGGDVGFERLLRADETLDGEGREGGGEGEEGVDEDRVQRVKDAETRALTLELIGDLPFAEIDPPDTILFVCKLNFCTREDDLELIFSRFGEITSCKITRDPITALSKGFAFIHFLTREACEMAYFKMDNVLIDDRRIRVDFSQSVRGRDERGVREVRSGNKREKEQGEKGKGYEMVFGGEKEEVGGRVRERERRDRSGDRLDGRRRDRSSDRQRLDTQRRDRSSDRQRHGTQRRDRSSDRQRLDTQRRDRSSDRQRRGDSRERQRNSSKSPPRSHK